MAHSLNGLQHFLADREMEDVHTVGLLVEDVQVVECGEGVGLWHRFRRSIMHSSNCLVKVD